MSFRTSLSIIPIIAAANALPLLVMFYTDKRTQEHLRDLQEEAQKQIDREGLILYDNNFSMFDHVDTSRIFGESIQIDSIFPPMRKEIQELPRYIIARSGLKPPTPERLLTIPHTSFDVDILPMTVIIKPVNPRHYVVAGLLKDENIMNERGTFEPEIVGFAMKEKIPRISKVMRYLTECMLLGVSNKECVASLRSTTVV